MKIRIATVLLVLISCNTAISQVSLIKAIKTELSTVIDGRLDDEVWKEAETYKEFRMVEPSPGSDPSERTELRVIYTKTAIIFGVRCYDSEPRRISANTLVHDQSEERNEDQVSILLDPFLDKRSGYIFIVNPKGARTEGFATGEHFSLGWDGLWETRCTIDKEGWSAEIRIPFLTISFNPRLTEWGFNFERYIARKQEVIRYSGINLNSFFSNAGDAGILKGIENIKQGLGVTFRPYGKVARNDNKTDNLDPDNKLTGGFDIYKNITPNLIGAITINTDFAETEVDERKLNLTRFPLYYPEKRTFFLEGSDIFEFGNTNSRTFLPFFSRRIGLLEGDQVPINWGTKLFGKIGNTNLSMLDVQSGYSDIARSTNMFAGRISQNILQESKVGVLLTNGSQDGSKNTLAGVDFMFKTSKFMGSDNFTVDIWGVNNWNEKSSGNKSGFGFKIDYPNDLIDAAISYTFFGDSIDPGLGFLPRMGYHMSNLGFRYMPRPEKGYIGKLIRQFTFGFRLQNYWKTNGDPESVNLSITPLNFRSESGEQVEMDVRYNRDVLPADFEVSDGIVIPVGDYRFVNYSIRAATASHRKLVFEIASQFGEFYQGHLTDIAGSVSFRFDGYLTLQVGANNVRGWLPQGNFTENVLFTRLNLYINPDLGLSNYIQYDDVTDEAGYNGRLFWQIRPGNIIYLVYNSNIARIFDPEARFQMIEDQVLFKVQMSIRF